MPSAANRKLLELREGSKHWFLKFFFIFFPCLSKFPRDPDNDGRCYYEEEAGHYIGEVFFEAGNNTH